MRKILFFCAWFPSKANPLAGKFILDHAKCLNDKINIAVFHVYGDRDLETWLKFESFELNGVQIYKQSFRRIRQPLLLPANVILYFVANVIGYVKVKKKFGIADLNHVHVLTKTAVLPCFLKLFYNTPYVITEHWSRYLPERNSYSGTIRKWVTKKVVDGSNGLSTVSKDLMDAMADHKLQHKNSVIISNVLADEWFVDYERVANQIFTFLHVSGMQDSIKNVRGILRATYNLKQTGLKFRLDIVGDDKERVDIEDYSKSLQLDDCITFHGELYGNKLMEKYRHADAFVLFSNFENQPVVLLESFASGVPVIATRAGGIPEIVKPRNGILVDARDEEALFEAMRNLINGNECFDRKLIGQEAKQKHSSSAVATQIIEFYQKALTKNS